VAKNREEELLDEKIATAMEKAAAAGAKAAVDALMPAVATLVAEATKPKHLQDAAAPKPKKPKCPICLQPNLACGYVFAKNGEPETPKEQHHRKLPVYPGNPNLGKWFQGVIFNGVRYLSNSKQHSIWVPKDSNIEYIIELWEQNEQELATGREAHHNSGSLSKNGSNFTAAQSAWR